MRQRGSNYALKGGGFCVLGGSVLRLGGSILRLRGEIIAPEGGTILRLGSATTKGEPPNESIPHFGVESLDHERDVLSAFHYAGSDG